ncbi:B box-type domain-containing protein [Balamuthia mandrillaris]
MYFYYNRMYPSDSSSSSDEEDSPPRSGDEGEDEEEDSAPKSKQAAILTDILTNEDAPLSVRLREIVDEEDEDEAEGEKGETPSSSSSSRHDDAKMCVECEDQPADVYCQNCEDLYCEVCWHAQHRRGKRAKHSTQPLQQKTSNMDSVSASSSSSSSSASSSATTQHSEMDGEEREEEEEEQRRKERRLSPVKDVFAEEDTSMDASSASQTQQERREDIAAYFMERTKYIPVRLSLKERKMLRLLEAALNVSEYTDKIDIISARNKAQRIQTQIKDICAILTGLLVASDYRKGQKLVKQPSFKENAEFFQNVFEVGRRHKIMNPEKMRTEYGKLVYLLQDSVSPVIQEMLEFSCVKPITTVYSFLEQHGAIAVLQDPNVLTATMEIHAEGKPRYQVQREIKSKERAIEYLSKRYESTRISADEIKLCLYSIGDNHSFLRSNRDPIDKMIRYLTTLFHSDRIEEPFSLAIRGGRGGARLTHDHKRQYHYALQSLTLWREITHDMFKLWYLAESDLLDEQSPYRLRDTGQGLNRVQRAPRISKTMHTILHQTQCKLGNWVGSSVIHLGDHNVPNALMFIDKYTQVARILNPIVHTIEELDRLDRDPHLRAYIKSTFGGTEAVAKLILTDFFRHAFDGSGADNFFDAGSCIDGRLTSAWNWCSQIEKKSYFPIFKLAGFVGFDGDFQK